MLDLTGYTLTFDEEFNRRDIAQTAGTATWGDIRSQFRGDINADVGFGASSFVDAASGYDPFHVGGGALTITAVPDRTSYGVPTSWESGLITTQGSFSQTYGYFEIRADFSNQPGAWDAFWLLPDTQLPDPNRAGRWQELDIVEHYGSWDKGVYSGIHTTDPAPNEHWQKYLQVYSEMHNPSGYHTYGMNWQADKISFYVDGQFVGSQATPSDLHGPMYLVANLATQRDAANNADVAGVPISSSIDYIRVYSNAPTTVAVALDTISSPDGRDPGLYGARAAPANSIPGASGNNIYIVDDVRDVVVEGRDRGDDRVVASVSYTLSDNVERLTLVGSKAIDATGNDLANHLVGNGAANVLDGKGGADLMQGGAGNDVYRVDHAADRVIEAVGGGRDTVITTVSYRLAAGQEIETLQTADAAGKAALKLTGNEFGNTLVGNAGDNVLEGGAGIDVMRGGAGNDVYAVDRAEDRVFEAKGQGRDTVVATVSYALQAGQEIETLQFAKSTGTKALKLTGNEFANTLIGNGGANTLNGGLGADVLTGGKGADTFVFATKLGAGSLDRITDFAVEDTIRLSKSIFLALAPGELKANEFKDVAKAKIDADDHILYDSRNGDLFYDADGSGKAAAVKFAVLDNEAAITHADFFVV